MLPHLNWAALRARHDAVAEQLQAQNLDTGMRQKLQREYAAISQVVALLDKITATQQEINDLKRQEVGVEDADFAELLSAELAIVQERYTEIESDLNEMLYPGDPLDEKGVFLEIRAGTGGQEAALFASDLARMYMLYAARRGWNASLMSESATDLGGYREAVLQIKGKRVYRDLKHESGVHRVQRVPTTETAGRVHTSTATVAVLPEADDNDTSIVIDPKDLRIDVYRSSGAGGQHVNTTDSAVRITHLPTNIVVACQDERSQHKNKAKALKVLQSRLLAAQREKIAAEQSAERKRQIGTGDRSEKVRTYNFPQNRVSDHQADITVKNLDMVMEGHMEVIIDALREMDRDQRQSQPVSVGGFVVPVLPFVA